ncbi:MAG: hypothetical protein ACI9WC_003066, partial [Arenicella sp.]
AVCREKSTLWNKSQRVLRVSDSMIVMAQYLYLKWS